MNDKLITNPFCLVFGHNYYLKKNPKTNKPIVFCKSCNKQFRYSINGNLIETIVNKYNIFSNENHLNI